MKYLFTFLILFVLFSIIPNTVNASWVHKCDSLPAISESGYAMVDTTHAHSLYYLDTNDDGEAEYKLNFGPWWYMPDSSEAIRPIDGQFTEIEGFVCMCCDDSIPVIKVSTIDGLFWRDPFYPSWNKVGKKHQRHIWSYRNHHGFAFGWLNDSLAWAEVSGVALVDTTFKNYHYYLDVDDDTIPDYQLNFGPPWYDSSDDVDRPESFESVKIGGYLFEKKDLNLIFVIELNDFVWIDTSSWQGHLGGAWIYRNMNQHRKIHVMHDSTCGFKFTDGWFVNNQGEKNPPDSVFCQMLELYPENVPYANQERILAAYEIGLFKPNHQNMLAIGDSIGSQIGFTNQIRYTLRYQDKNIKDSNIQENKLAVKIWNYQTRQWDIIESALFEYDKNMVNFDLNAVPGLIIISEEIATTVSQSNINQPTGFQLMQNYPNPFNSGTKIEFYLSEPGMVDLSIYNILGEKVITILNKDMSPGLHYVNIELSELSSGIYYYMLITTTGQAIRKMVLLK
ncbi:MAG: T9SS type A sorting domain-containing protein [Calditrichaceae bacterium]